VDNPEREIIGLGRAIAYLIVWVAFAFVVFRLGVASVWGWRNDLAPVAAVALAAAGVLGLAYLAAFLVRDWKKRLSKDS
jgi:hypothetical protein